MEEVPEDTFEGENPSDAEEQVEIQITGGAVAPTEVRLQDDTDQKENIIKENIIKETDAQLPSSRREIEEDMLEQICLIANAGAEITVEESNQIKCNLVRYGLSSFHFL